MERAEAAVYAHEQNQGIKKRFDLTSQPERVHVSQLGPVIGTHGKW
jgi:hypothetical protein